MAMVKSGANQADLGSGKIGKLLFQLAAPAIAAQVINALYNMVDRMYIGRIPEHGDLALTGIGVTFPIIMLISAFASLISMGGAPRASIAMGKKDLKSAERVLGNCTLSLVVIAAVLTAAVLCFRDPLLLLFGASENTLPFARSYLTIYASGTLFVQLALGLNAFITAQGFSLYSMATVLIGAVTNIILDPILIFGCNMGVQGAALATIISQAVSACWVVLFLCGKSLKPKGKGEDEKSGSATHLKLRLANLKIQPSIMLPVVALGLSPFIMQSTESILLFCFNSSLLKYGGDNAVGAMTILSSVMQMLLLPLMGLTQGAQPIVSYNYGAGNGQRVKKAFQLLITCAFSFTTLLWLSVMLFPGAFASIFTNDVSLMKTTEWALRIYMAGTCLMGAQIACQQTFIALGNAKTSAMMAILRKIVLLIPLIYILPNFFENQVLGVFLAEPVADVIASIVTTATFLVSFRKLLKTMEARSAEKAVDEPELQKI